MTTTPYFHAPHTLSKRKKLMSHAQIAWVGYSLFLALYAFVFSQWQAEPVPANVHVMGVLVAAVCLVPLTLWYARGKQKLPMFEMICISYFLSFSMPLYLQLNQITTKRQRFAWDTTYETLWIVLIGMGMMIISYYSFINSPFLRRGAKLDLPLDPKRTSLYFKIFIFCGLPIVVLQNLGVTAVGGAGAAFLNFQFSIAMVLLSYRVFDQKRKMGTPWVVLLYCSTILSTLSGLMSGMLETALMPLILLTIIRWHATQKIPKGWIFAGFMLFVVLNSVKIAYRDSAWSGNTSGLAEKANLWLDLSQGAVTSMAAGGESSGFEKTVRGSMSRFDQLHIFVMIKDMTPVSVPFYDGKTYSYFVYGLIPRFIWPDKPVAQQGNNAFALDYGLIDPSQVNTVSMGMSQLAECYANFGFWGVVFIMPLQGIFFSVIDKILNGPLSDGGKAIYVTIMFAFLNGIGGVASSIFLGVISNVVASAFILRLFCLNWKSKV